jgi:hypothetical protein
MALIFEETLNPWWEQFAITGFPSGLVISGQVYRGTKYQLTTAQLLALQTTAVTLVPAPVTGGGISTPPAGFAYYPTRLKAEYIFNSTAFTIANADNAFQIEYVGKSTALLSMLVTGLVDQSASTIAVNSVTTPGPKIALANCANLGLEVKLIGTTPALTLGNGAVNLFLEYTIIPLF